MATKHNEQTQKGGLNRAREMLAAVLRAFGVGGAVGVVFVYTAVLALVFQEVIGDAIAGTEAAFWIETTMAVPPTAATVVLAVHLSNLLNGNETDWSETVLRGIGAAWVLSPLFIWTYYNGGF